MTFIEKKLKNAYIGGYYEYSYDFRNKNSTILTNDWWVLVSWSPTFNANWINWQCLYKNPSLWEWKLSNAKKITIKMSWTPYQSNWIWCRIGVETTTSWTTWRTWNYMQANKEETSIYWTNYGDTSKSWSGKQTLITVVDLEAKTWVTTISAGYTWNWTLSSTEVSNIRDNSKVIAYNWWTSCVGESITIVVEY